MENVKVKFAKAGDDFMENCKEIGTALAEMFRNDETPAATKTLHEVVQ